MPEKENTEEQKKGEKEEMTFWEHLEALRWHLVRSIASVVVLAVVAFLNKNIIFNKIILSPKSSEFITNRLLCKLGKLLSTDALCVENFNLQIINIKMAGQFITHLYISIVAGFIIAVPYIIWEIWRFVKPALYQREMKYSGGAVFYSSLLFIIGVLFSYFLVVPLAVMFLGMYNVSESVHNYISLGSYIGTVVSLSLSVGLVFEMPIFVYFFTKVGIVTPSFMRKNRKYMIVIVLIISAIITPADVFSQLLVAFPLLGLYEISILISDRVYKKRSEELAG